MIALDLVVGSDSEAPIGCWAGGTCGNVLSILAYLKWDAYPVARLNGDVASQRVCADMRRWGVHLDWMDCVPTTDSPIVVHRIRRAKDGQSKHRFSWLCPNCGKWLPGFRPITVDAVERIKPTLAGASVFFFDRLSRGTLMLAAEASDCGAVVVFEPSSRGERETLGGSGCYRACRQVRGQSPSWGSGSDGGLLCYPSGNTDPRRTRAEVPSSTWPWYLQLDTSQGRYCTAAGGRLRVWRLVYSRTDCQGWCRRTGGAASRRRAGHPGCASIWSSTGGLELRF